MNRDESVQNEIGISSQGGSTQFACCNITQNSIGLETSGGALTGTSPGASVVNAFGDHSKDAGLTAALNRKRVKC